MSSFRIRPRFKHLVSSDQEKVEELLKSALKKRTEDFHTEAITGHITIKTPLLKRHVWSPQLNLTFEQTEEGTIIRGLYGPNPTVWAVFFFGYVALGLCFLFLGMWGFTRWNLDMSTEILWGLPVLAGLALVLYLLAQTGQKVGAQEMFDLHHFYEEVIHEKIEVH